MTKREYLRVMWAGHNAVYGSADNLLVSVSDGRLGGDPRNAIQIQNKRESKMHVEVFEQMMNQIGEEGWEMVGIDSMYLTAVDAIYNQMFYAWFKRPKA